MIDLSDLFRTASQSSLGLLGLVVIAMAVLASLLSNKDDKNRRLAVFAALLVGAASFVVATIVALRDLRVRDTAAPVSPARMAMTLSSAPTQRLIVVTLDRTNDYRWGAPGNLFDHSRTNHMMRTPVAGGMWSAAGGSPPFRIGWIVRPPRAGRYELRVRYASVESRPTKVQLDDQTLFTALTHTTGNWSEPTWFTEGTIELHEGVNHFGLSREQPPPNIDAVQLTALDQ